ncbi:MAG: LamG domain-containing protein [Woeseiaceae bacterium]|nr:LamG domain-containing protein [Woeseiaceae bacterium]
MSRRAAVARTGRAAAAVLLSCLALPAAALPVCTSETITFRDFNGISGSSDSNVIGVGDQGTAYRYGGSGWSVMATPTFEDLNDVEVVDAGTAFAVGDDGAALQLVGGNWIDRSGFTGRDLYGIWAASATEAYAVGDRGEIWRWDGVGWSDESGAAGTDNRDIEDVWGDANFVYAMSERGELYIYDRAAGSWGPRDDLCRSGNNFSDLWGDGSGNIYMVRQRRVYLNDGSNCQIVENTGDDLNGIYGGGGRIVAGGDGGAVTENDGSGWQETDEASEDINDVWVSPAGSAWFGGNGGEVTSCVAVVPNLIADWPLDDCTLGFDGSAVIDSGPNGLNGTSVGGLNVEPNGQLCSAAEFNGSSSFVRVPDTAALDTTDGFSVAVWVRHDNTPLKNWEAILAKGDNSYRLHLNGGCGISDSLPGNTQYGFTLGLNGGCAGADLNSNVVPTPGVWYHVAATYDRSVMRIYINGTLVNSANYSAAINNSNFDLFIGENSQQRNRYWDGDIDELALWDNAITAQMINDHMNRTRPCVSCTSVEFEINHDNYGIHCVDEAVQVSVVDGLGGTPRLDYNGQVTLDTQTGNGSWSLVSGGGVLNDGAGDDGVATYQWVLGEDSAVFALTYPQGIATFDIDVYQASDPGIRDTDAEGR